MADYVSSLNGVQMDSALLDMAEHTSEAWAVGERNGVDVPPDDVTYQNNAKYYAAQAQSIAPASVTQAVRWDIAQTALTEANKAQARQNIGAADSATIASVVQAVDDLDQTAVKVSAQTLTTAQQEQARANICAGSSNPNILTNPWFGSGEVVNQRGISSGTTTANMNAIDRWIFSYGSTGGTYSLGASGLSITGNAGGFYVVQRFEDSLKSFLTGKTVTLSAMLSNGTILSATGQYAEEQTWLYNENGFRMGFTSIGAFQVRADSGVTVVLRAVKMELGSVSTLGNDTPTAYADELAKCMRYFQRIRVSTSWLPVAFGMCESSVRAKILIPTAVPMKTGVTPTLSSSGTAKLVGNNSASVEVTSFAFLEFTANGIGLRANVSSGLTEHKMYGLYLSQNAYIDISVDL